MEEPRHKFFRGTVGVIFVSVLAIILVLLYRYYFHSDNSINENQNDTQIQENNFSSAEDQASINSATPTNLENPDKYYTNSIALADQGKYSEAITEINRAIALDDKNEIYWSKKASYYTLLEDKASAKATLEEGLRTIPGSDILQTRLDLIDKDSFNNADGVRE